MNPNPKPANGWMKRCLALFAALAFLAVLSTIDTSEQFRTWRAARGWTTAQRSVAPAMDAESMFVIATFAIVCDTIVVALSAIGALILGISVALENKRGLEITRTFGMTAAIVGLLYSLDTLLYRWRVGERRVLKGPVFDYNLSMQPTILIALVGFIFTFGLWILLMKSVASESRRARQSGGF